jgi:tetratricopeptide (TPR) repeat protein
MGDRLRVLWDFEDLDGSWERFEQALDRQVSAAGRAEVLTQLARVQGLRGNLAAGDRLLDEAETTAADSPLARVRVLLERGRLRRSGGDSQAALPLFAAAFDLATEATEEALAADAAHMAALAAADHSELVAWTRRGVELAERATDPDARYWLGPLLNNLGWACFAAGQYEEALEAFQRALRARERDPRRRAEIEIARYAVAKTLRVLGRPAAAAALLEEAVAWTRTVEEPDGWFHEELAEAYAALGREADARQQARLALPLLKVADTSFTDDTERASRLRALAGQAAG